MKELAQHLLVDNHPLTKILETLPDLYLFLSPDLIIINASNAYLKATFTDRNKIVGKYLFEVFPDNPDIPEAKGVENLNASLQLVLTTKLPHSMAIQRYDVPGPDKKKEFIERYWQPVNTPVLDEKGEVIYIIHQVKDVTEDFKGKAELRATQQREINALVEIDYRKTLLNDLFEQAPVAITILSGTNYVIELANPAVCEIWGRVQKEVVGKPLFDALPEVRGQGLEALLDNVLSTGVPYVGKELPVTLNRAKGAEVVYFNFVYKPLLEKDTIRGIIVVANDVTDQVLARQSVEENQKVLLELNKELVSANEEIQASNEELVLTQEALNKLNSNLEKNIATRTEQLKIAKEEAESNRLRIHTVFMQAPVGIAIFEGKEYRIELANPTVCKMVGRSIEQVINKPLFEAIPELEGQGFKEIFSSIFREGKPYELKEIPATLDKDGKLEKGFYHIIFHPIVNLENQVTGIIEVVNEVTEAVVARNKLETREKELEALTKELAVSNKELTSTNEEIRFLLDAMPQKVWRADGSGNINYFNKHWIDYTGRSLEELKEWGWSDIIHPDDLADNIRLWKHSIDTGTNFEYEHRFRKHNGEYRWHLSRGIPRKDIKGNIVMWVGTNTDIHEHKILEHKLQETAKELAAAHKEVMAGNEELISNNEDLALANQKLLRVNSDLDNFIYIASHDLKAPIANIEGLTSLLIKALSHTIGEKEKYLLDLIEKSVSKLKKIIGDLTEITKVQKGLQESHETIYFEGLLEEIIADIAPLVDESQVKIQTNFKIKQIQYSKKNLRSILYNLLSNAIKYRSSQRQAQVEISTKDTGEYILLVVKDNGLGIASDQIHKLFTMFKRLHTHVEGTGIGLYIVKRIIENRGGYIEVESKLGEGTTFRVYFAKEQQ